MCARVGVWLVAGNRDVGSGNPSHKHGNHWRFGRVLFFPSSSGVSRASCSLFAHRLFIVFSLFVHCFRIVCPLFGHCFLIVWSFFAHCLLIVCSLFAHCLLIVRVFLGTVYIYPTIPTICVTRHQPSRVSSTESGLWIMARFVRNFWLLQSTLWFHRRPSKGNLHFSVSTFVRIVPHLRDTRPHGRLR